MAFGLTCLVTNMNAVRAIGTAMRSMADTIIGSDPNASVTARDLYNRLKKSGVDIDMESAAYIYADTFASDINNYSNFETQEQLEKYAEKHPPVSVAVKQALKDAGYKKTNKEGKEILDWTKLMGKTEEEIIKEISDQNFDNEDEIFNALQNEYKQIISTAIIKSKNDLSRRNERITPKQKNAIDRIADLQVRGLFSDFQDDYNNAMSRAIGADSSQIDAMNEIDEIAKAARMLQQSGIGTNNYLGQQLQKKVNDIVSKARYRDASWMYKIAKAISNIIELANLAILNNISNRGQNFLSGKVGRVNSSIGYGMSTKEVDKLSSATKSDLIKNGGVDFGDVANMFNGDRHSSEKVREWINNLVSKDGESRAANWWFSQIMGTAALNGIDNYNKVKNTWGRFLSGLTDILMSKGMTKKAAEQKLHEEIFGQKWQDARDKGEKIMLKLQQAGAPIKISPEAIDRFGADLVKAELINNKIFTEDELNAAWEAGYKSAGLEMGHVANNPLSSQLQKWKNKSQNNIDKALTERNYTKAAFQVLKDMLFNKMIMRFAGGGTNWVVLKLEKGGLGLFTGLLGRVENASAYRDRKSLSEMSNEKIEENIYDRQRINDRIMRGLTGLTTNTALLLIASAAFGGDEDKERKKKVMKWLDSNKWVNKYLNNWLPVYISGYLAYKQQESKGGAAGISNQFEYSPARTYISNLINKNDDYSVFTGLMKSASIFSPNEENQAKGWGELGKVVGGFFNFNPLPYKPIKDAVTVYKGMTGGLAPYAQPTSFPEGLFKFGMFDWPKSGEGSQRGYTSEEMKDPTFKYFLDKGLSLPHTSLSSEVIKDEESGKKKKVSEYPKDVQEQYIVEHNKYLKEELSDIREQKTVYVNKFGDISINPPQGDYEEKDIDDLDEKQLAKVLSIAQSKATKRAKDKMFYQK